MAGLEKFIEGYGISVPGSEISTAIFGARSVTQWIRRSKKHAKGW